MIAIAASINWTDFSLSVRPSRDGFAAEDAAALCRGHPYMMSASQGERGSWKSGRSKGGCMNFVV